MTESIGVLDSAVSETVHPEVWFDGFRRCHVLVPITVSRPRDLARDIMILELASKPGLFILPGNPTWNQRIAELSRVLDEPGFVTVNLGADAQHAASRAGQVEYVEYAMPQDEL